ncbi:MAG: hypothetical protein NZL87_10185, partial [Thermomicrobium sp.]|nr:hypothetical protein [Thermomicrobium sp.]
MTFPLLDPLLRWIASPASSGSRPALHLYAYLVATDQREARFRETDTAPLAELVTRWLEKVRPERFGGLSARSRLFTGNPAAFDETLRHFRSLATRKVLPQRLEAPEFLVHVTSGTPALVFGVLLGLAPILPPETRVVVMPPESTRPLPFELLRALGRLQASRDASLALAHWAPELAATLLERSNAPDSLVEAVRAFRDRLSFDFRRALARLEQQVLPSASSELRRWATAQRDEVASLAEAVDALRRTSPAPRLVQLLLYELWQGTRIAGEQSRSLEFLARLFRLEEALLRWTVEQWLALPTGATRDEQGRSRSLPEYRRALDRGGPLHELAERFRI